MQHLSINQKCLIYGENQLAYSLSLSLSLYLCTMISLSTYVCTIISLDLTVIQSDVSLQNLGLPFDAVDADAKDDDLDNDALHRGGQAGHRRGTHEERKTTR